MGEIVVATDNRLPTWGNWPTCLQTSSNQILAVIQSLGQDYVKNVAAKYVIGVGIDRSVQMCAPTFRDVAKMYGKKGALFWLRIQLYNTFEFVGIIDTISSNQIREVSNLIISDEIWGQLTLSEFLCFLKRFKEGRYEKIYSSNHPNMQEFMKCLPEFWHDLVQARRRASEEARRLREERDRKNPDLMTKEEWEEIKMLTKMYEMTW